jgi:hypothetical protein
MFLSRAKAVKNAAAASAALASGINKKEAVAAATPAQSQKIPDLSHYIDSRDYLGAVTLLEVFDYFESLTNNFQYFILQF